MAKNYDKIVDETAAETSLPIEIVEQVVECFFEHLREECEELQKIEAPNCDIRPFENYCGELAFFGTFLRRTHSNAGNAAISFR